MARFRYRDSKLGRFISRTVFRQRDPDTTEREAVKPAKPTGRPLAPWELSGAASAAASLARDGIGELLAEANRGRLRSGENTANAVQFNTETGLCVLVTVAVYASPQEVPNVR